MPLHVGLFLWGWGVHDPLQSFPTRVVRGPSPSPSRNLQPAPGPGSPSGSSTVRARRSERVRRLSCSMALSILGAPPAPPPLDRRPPHSAPYIPPQPRACGWPRQHPISRGRPGPRVQSPDSAIGPTRKPRRRRHRPRLSRPSCRRWHFRLGDARPSGNCGLCP